MYDLIESQLNHILLFLPDFKWLNFLVCDNPTIDFQQRENNLFYQDGVLP